jgi:hypothetical protein
MIFSITGWTGTDLSRLPLPCTCSRISPGLPASESEVRVRISADRRPATRPSAITRTSRSGQGSLARRAPSAAADSNRSGVSSPRNGLGDRGGALGAGHRSHRVAGQQTVGHTEGQELVPGGPGTEHRTLRVPVRELAERGSQRLGSQVLDTKLLWVLGQQGGDAGQVPPIRVRGVGGVLPGSAGREEGLLGSEKIHGHLPTVPHRHFRPPATAPWSFACQRQPIAWQSAWMLHNRNYA